MNEAKVDFTIRFRSDDINEGVEITMHDAFEDPDNEDYGTATAVQFLNLLAAIYTTVAQNSTFAGARPRTAEVPA